MTTETLSLTDDIRRAHGESPTHLWGAIASAAISMFLPIVGLIAAYSGFQVKKVMHRNWVGLVFAAVGAANVVLWLAMLALWQFGYIELAV
ncbi:hypothetical protein [Halobiforma nitratireducens]|uniref:Uncharacterized protein n=1 Tax=Halobiforma nitratireducens JCM 10879 TaxID=1227454 RepID=M0M609_9EURY|nr:hypothetical protein [Halobiforma nitratireducens]EMA41131.1 hypothetical protein C446_06225 [Halobiforma nitratireducens JCM 10879]